MKQMPIMSADWYATLAAEALRAWGLVLPRLGPRDPAFRVRLAGCRPCHAARLHNLPPACHPAFQLEPSFWSGSGPRPGSSGSSKSASNALIGLVFCRRSGFTRSARRRPDSENHPHAPVPLFPADPARDPEGGRDCLPSADAAGRHDPAGGGRHLCLAAARLPRAQEDRADRARGAEPRRRDRASDAHVAARRPLARERPL